MPSPISLENWPPLLCTDHPNGFRRRLAASFKTGIAREAPFDEHSSDSAVAKFTNHLTASSVWRGSPTSPVVRNSGSFVGQAVAPLPSLGKLFSDFFAD